MSPPYHRNMGHPCTLDKSMAWPLPKEHATRKPTSLSLVGTTTGYPVRYCETIPRRWTFLLESQHMWWHVRYQIRVWSQLRLLQQDTKDQGGLKTEIYYSQSGGGKSKITVPTCGSWWGPSSHLADACLCYILTYNTERKSKLPFPGHLLPPRGFQPQNLI